MILYDFKTGSPHPCTELQMAGYILLVREGIDKEGKKFIERDNKTAYEIILYHPNYNFAGTIDMIIDDGKETFQGYALYLKDDGTYKVEDHSKNYRRNKGIFLSFLVAEQWKLEKGLDLTNR